MPYKVLQVVNSLGMGGIEAFITNVQKHVDSSVIQFDYCTIGSKAKDRLETVRDLGSNVFYYPSLSARNYISYREWWTDFFKSHREYIAVHGHVYTTASIYLRAAHNAGLKTVCHSHSTDVLKPSVGAAEREIRKLLLKPLKTAPWIDERLACSRDAGEWLYGKNTPFKIINNAIELNNFRFDNAVREEYRKSLGLEDNFVIGHIGNGTAAKNHEFLLRVFDAAHKKNSNVKLLLIGNLGIQEEKVREYIHTNNLDEAVLILGTRKDVPSLLSAMDVFCFPSKNEGLGIVLIEAQTEGLPCVISDVIPEECDIRSGLITKTPLNKDPGEWADALLSKRTACERKSKLKEAAAAGYSIDDVADKMTKIYLGLRNEAKKY